jgi:hypothetical protein
MGVGQWMGVGQVDGEWGRWMGGGWGVGHLDDLGWGLVIFALWLKACLFRGLHFDSNCWKPLLSETEVVGAYI